MMGVWSNYQCEGQLSIFDFIDNPENQSVAESSQDTEPDVKAPAEVWAEETGYTDYWQHDIEFIDDKPVCTYSKHTCNRKELFKVAEMDNTIVCPHVCCRKCDEVMCGARCNGAELPKEKPLCSQAEECEAYPSGCGGTIEPCRFGGAYHWSDKQEEPKEDVHIDRDGREHKPMHWMKYERCENCIQWKRSDRNEQPPAGWGVFGFCMEHKYKCISTSQCTKFEDKRKENK